MDQAATLSSCEAESVGAEVGWPASAWSQPRPLPRVMLRTLDTIDFAMERCPACLMMLERSARGGARLVNWLSGLAKRQARNDGGESYAH